MDKFVLQTENLTKKYGVYTVLDNVSISLEKKHIYGFIGENGAGKSTFMKIITGLVYPTSGNYSIMGKESAREREKMRRHIGSMIEDPALYPNYTIIQNLELQRTLVGNPDIFIHKGKIIDVITHDELEARCRKYICIKTDVVPVALTVLDKIMDSPEYKVVSEDTIHLYSNMDNIEKISRAFMQHEIVVTELSVVDANQYTPVMEKVNLCEVVCEEILANYLSFEKKGITPLFEQADDEILVLADRKLLVRVVQNLISNGIKYSTGTMEFLITTGECVTLAISNSISEGIDTEKIFDKFYRADVSRNGEGAGLGLYICQKLVKEMNGKISASSDNEKLTINIEFFNIGGIC